MAWMRGTYYVFEDVRGGVNIGVGDVLRPNSDITDYPSDDPEIIDEYDREASRGSVRIPWRIMKRLAFECYVRMSTEEISEFARQIGKHNKKKSKIDV